MLKPEIDFIPLVVDRYLDPHHFIKIFDILKVKLGANEFLYFAAIALIVKVIDIFDLGDAVEIRSTAQCFGQIGIKVPGVCQAQLELGVSGSLSAGVFPEAR